MVTQKVAYVNTLRIVSKGALVQQANAVESLSNVDVLCMDKTGTLTANAMVLDALHPLNMEASDVWRRLGNYVASMSLSNATSTAIGAACDKNTPRNLHVCEEVPFSSSHKWSALSIDDATQRGIYVMGAPEILQPYLRNGTELEALIEEGATRGLRMVLFACYPDIVPLHDADGEPCLPGGLIALGLVSLRDTLRSEVQKTLSSFVEAGIQLKIISGDHAETVAVLAKQAGLEAGIKVVSGEELTGIYALQKHLVPLDDLLEDNRQPGWRFEVGYCILG